MRCVIGHLLWRQLSEEEERQKPSLIVQRLKHAGQLLLGGAASQIEGYRGRFEALQGTYEAFLNRLIRQYSDERVDPQFVDSFFKKRILKFVGIDGTLHKRPVFDLVIFFAGAYVAQRTITVDDSGILSVAYEDDYKDAGISVSSVLPVYINEVPLIDQTILPKDITGQTDTSFSIPDDQIIDNSAFADYLMMLAEFYLAYKMVVSDRDIDILLMDRVCSAELASSYAETSELRMNLERESGLIGTRVGGETFTATDWIYARRLFGDLRLNTPPGRGEYLISRVITELLRTQVMTRPQIIEALGLNTQRLRDRLDKELEDAMRDRDPIKKIITRKDAYFSIIPRYRDLHERIERLVTTVCGRIFSDDPRVTYEKRFKSDGRWLTTGDLAFLGLMCLYLTIETCWRRHILLVGVAKDTSARDFKRQLIPVLNHTGRLQQGFSPDAVNTPDTDRMILQWIALREREQLPVPWSTIEYDTAFKTITPHHEGVKGLVSGARRNQIALNMTFAKAYFQLSEASSDNRLRSSVLLYDRLVYPEVDLGADRVVVLHHDYESPDEPEQIEVLIYDEADNPMQRFIVVMCKRMTSPSIPELFGHIRPLFIADKVAKFYQEQFRQMVESTGVWLVNRPELREFIFYLGSFRERRSDVEQTRRGSY